MILRTIPSTGETVPAIGLGSWQTFDVSAGEAEGRGRGEGVGTSVRLGGEYVGSARTSGEGQGEDTVLRVAEDRGIAVLANRPFAEGTIFSRLRRRTLPDWASEIGCASWAELLLKFVISHPAVTCAIPATSDVEHLRANM